jgi:hypothetical protein
MALLKAHDAPLISTRPISTQLQIVSLVLDKDNVQEDANQAFFMHLHQFTRHLYAPLTKSARQHAQQQEVLLHIQAYFLSTEFYFYYRHHPTSLLMKMITLQSYRSASASWTSLWNSVSEARPFPTLYCQHFLFSQRQRS